MRRISEPVSSGRPACIVPIALLPKKFRMVKVPWLGGVASRLVIKATTTAPGRLAWPVSGCVGQWASKLQTLESQNGAILRGCNFLAERGRADRVSALDFDVIVVGRGRVSRETPLFKEAPSVSRETLQSGSLPFI